MATIFTVLIGFFAEFGSGSAVVQKQEIGQAESSSIFWLNLFIGIITTGITIIAAPLIAMFFKEPRLSHLLMVLSSVFILSSLSNIPHAIIVKNLEFRFIYIIRISCTVLSGITAIVLAYMGYGVWSLVCQTIAEELFIVLLLWSSGKWYPSRHFQWAEARVTMKFSINYLGFNIVNFISERLPQLLIGKFLGSEALGFFSLAQRLISLPIETISFITGNVLFPVFSRIQNDNTRIGEIYLLAMQHAGFIIFPSMVGLLITAPDLIPALFGVKWSPAIFLLQVLSVSGIIQVFSTNNGVLYLSKGRTDIQFKMGLIFLFIMAFAIYWGMNWGVNGVAISYAIVSFAIIYPSLRISYNIVDLRVYRLLVILKDVFVITLIMGVAVLFISLMLRYYGLGPLLLLILSIMSGIIIYTILSLVINRNLLASFYEMVHSRE